MNLRQRINNLLKPDYDRIIANCEAEITELHEYIAALEYRIKEARLAKEKERKTNNAR